MAVFATPEISTLLLVALLIVAFVVAFKIMQMVFQTIFVAVMASGFYLALVYLFEFPLRLDRVLLFAFMGATLYMGFSFLASAYYIVARLLEVPYTVVKTLLIPLGYVYSYLKSSAGGVLSGTASGLRRKLESLERDETSSSRDRPDRESEQDVKEVVLDKVRDDED